jgi:hypothetical protein
VERRWEGRETEELLIYDTRRALNMGSPWNQAAGWSSGDLSAVKAHMEAQREKHAASLQK